MPDHPKDERDTYPFLGRVFARLDRPGSANWIILGLVVISVALFFADFTFKKYGQFTVESWPGFFGFYGFISFTGLILLAKLLRVLIRRPEDYYGDKSIDTEDYPPAGLERRDHGAD